MANTSPHLVDLRKVIAVIVVGGLCGLLMVEYIRLIEPAAAREVQAACNGMRPSTDNGKLGDLSAGNVIAPDFEVTDYTGKAVRLSDYRGRVVFVNFWATWCGVCKSEKPGLEKMTRELAGEDLAVLALASDADWNNIAQMFPNGSPLTILLDPPPEEDELLGAVAQSYGITAVPESFIIDKHGVIRHYMINKRDWSAGVAKTCITALIDE